MPNKQSNTVSTAKKLETQIKALNISKLQTVFDVAAESQVQFTEQVVKAKGSAEDAKMLYQWAKNAANNQRAEKRAQQLRNDPVLQGMTKLNTQTEAKPLRTSARSLADNNIPERAEKYVLPSSIQSMFSPGRYLCELYEVAQELHATDNSLHIDKRRPDLQTLVLSNETTQQEVSTLDILLKTLQEKINLDQLAAATGKYDDDSFTLPYDDNLTIINAVLESKHSSLRNITTQLADDTQQVKLTPALVQEQLGLNPASYDLLKAESSLTDNKRLAHAAKLTVSQLNKLILDIQGNSHSTNEQVLTVVSEYVRLNQQYGLSVEQLSAIIRKIDDSATGEIIPRLFGLSFSQAEMLLTLSDKPEVMKNIAQGDVSTILSAISELENIVQWMSKQKLDLVALNAMLTDKYSTTTTPELFNFLSNIYYSVDKQTEKKLLNQSLCRSLAAGFHLKIEVITGLVSWLESNDPEFSLEKFNLAITEVFSDSPTLEKLEHHPLLVTQCQKLSQYVLIAQWAKLTPQDIDLLLQPKLINGNKQPLQPGLPLLRLLADFKSWQQQIKVPVSEALRYFTLFSDHTNVDKLTSEIKELEKQLEEENKNSEVIDTQYKELSNKIKPLEILVKSLDVKINNMESNIKIKTDTIIYLMNRKEQGNTIDEEELKKLTNERLKLIDDFQSKIKDKKIKVKEIEKINNSLNLANTQKKPFDKKREELHIIIKNKTKTIDELTKSEENTLVKIHGWNHQQTNEIIHSIFTNKYPTQFIDIIKLCKHINMCYQVKITSQDLLNLNYFASEMDNNKLKSVIKSTAKSLIASL
ncbi:Tc toxin subunit A [Yersinia enterocolitica]|uniref:Tc toxin subunit A n=1 Tax=Yersinia enterocolitica TaxID=630 RepID=UPI003D0321FC